MIDSGSGPGPFRPATTIRHGMQESEGRAMHQVLHLPDVLVHIFSFLGLYDLVRVQSVCHLWRAVARLPELWRTVDCTHLPLTSRGWTHLAVPGIVDLCLRGCHVSDEALALGLSTLKATLKRADLRSTPAGFQTAAALSTCSQLEVLDLRGCHDPEALPSNNTRLRELKCGWTSEADAVVWVADYQGSPALDALEGCKHLEVLEACGYYDLDDQVVARALRACTSLKRVCLSYARVDQATCQELAQHSGESPKRDEGVPCASF